MSRLRSDKFGARSPGLERRPLTIAYLGVDHYRIPLPVVLSDSTHGDIAEFELVTVRLRDAAGAEGLGYRAQTALLSGMTAR